MDCTVYPRGLSQRNIHPVEGALDLTSRSGVNPGSPHLGNLFTKLSGHLLSATNPRPSPRSILLELSPLAWVDAGGAPDKEGLKGQELYFPTGTKGTICAGDTRAPAPQRKWA